MLSIDLSLALAPARTYRRLVRRPAREHRLLAARRPAFIALLIGTLVAISATGTVTFGLVASTTICWSFVPLVQMLAGALLIRTARRSGGLGTARALDLLFAGHVPWSLWLLAVTAWTTLAGPPHALRVWFLMTVMTGLIAMAWTAAIVFAFCRTVLETDTRAALARTALHQALIWTLTVSFVLLNIGGRARILGAIGR